MNKKGFTLIELLIVISIIGILTSIAFSSLNVGGIRAKTRDSQRIGDLKKIQTALELYFSDSRAYPEQTTWAGADATTFTDLAAYISQLPEDPLNTTSVADGFTCGSSATYGYRYITSLNGTVYILAAAMEVTAEDSPIDTLSNCGALDCTGTNPNCYGVQNPF